MKNFKRIYIVFPLMLMSLISIQGQDFQFSQFASQPAYINPALIGMSKYDYSVYSLYRKQWGALSNGYKTITAGGEATLVKGKENNLNAGLQFYHDNAGALALKRNNIIATLAYDLKATRFGRISYGISMELHNRNINMLDAKWESQYNGYYYDQSLPSNEQIIAESKSFVDFSAGAVYEWHKRGKGYHRFGVSVFNLLKSKQSFLFGNEDRLLRRGTFYYTGTIKIQSVTAIPQLAFSMQGMHWTAIGGTWLDFTYGESSRFTTRSTSSKFRVGLFYRWSQAVIGAVEFEYKRMFGARLSYDFNTSGVNQVIGWQGGFEVSIFHRGFFDKHRINLNQRGGGE